jgi:lysozyme
MQSETGLIRKHEGFRDKVYFDTEGVPTIGYGHAFLVGSKLPIWIIEALFWMDHAEAVKGYESLGLDLSDARRAVVVNMIFNLGLTRFLGFKETIRALRAGNYIKAAAEMLDSKWARQVGPGRSEELAQMMRTGLWPNERV